MTAVVQHPGFVPARVLPNEQLFYSPLDLFDFQADHVAEAYLRLEPDSYGGVIAVWDTGIGKSLLALATATMLYEDDKIDLVMVLCEGNKLAEWVEHTETFTALSAHRYHGTGRQRRLEKAGLPHVFITTHETGRNELLSRVKAEGKRGRGRAADGPLMATLGARNKRILWVFDEPKLRRRSSELYHAYEYVLRQLRRSEHHQRVMMLTATPIERDVEDAFNTGRIACPKLMPSIGEFEDTYTQGEDDYHRYQIRQIMKPQFAKLFQRLILRKRKSDRDVLSQFPKQVEKLAEVTLAPDHKRFYRAVEELLPDGENDSLRRTLLRMSAGHPASHIWARNEVSRAIVEQIGEDTLRAITSSKSDDLIARLKPLIKGQRAQVIVFTFYTSVLKELGRELRDAGYTVAEYHGGQSQHVNDQSRAAFLSNSVEILLASDKAAKGMNLRNAEYVFEYESAITYALRVQRINRVHRIDSELPSVTATTMVLRETIEESIFRKTLDRNKDQDLILGDEADDEGDFITADERKRMLALKRRQ